jgi:hypothetical protein
MSTESTKGPQRQTLEQRIEARYEHKTYKPGSAYQVREEMERLRDQVWKDLKNIHANTVAYKKSKEPQDYILYERGLAAEQVCHDVLDMIREAKR